MLLFVADKSGKGFVEDTAPLYHELKTLKKIKECIPQ
jgi:hypothetical protein